MAACQVPGLRAPRRRQAHRDHQPLPCGPATRSRRPPPPRIVSEESAPSAQRSGVLLGVGAFAWWGLCPGFFPLLLPEGSIEILAHRIVWSAICMVLVLVAARRLRDLRRLSGRT